jgi:hypothetical protein
MSNQHGDNVHPQEEYDHAIQKHDPQEGFDYSEPAARPIWGFAIGSIVLLVLLILAVQAYFDKIWNEAVYEKVLSVPGAEVGDLHNLENWRLTHYEYTDPSKTTVRIPLEEARKAFLADAQAGKTFYPAKPTEPKPETADAPAAAPGAPGAPAAGTPGAPPAAGAAPGPASGASAAAKK